MNDSHHFEESDQQKIEGVASEEPQESSSPDAKLTAAVELLVKELDALPDDEAKLQHTIAFMEVGLTQAKVPNFKNFWQARDLALSLFKSHISPAIRSTLWTKYSELSKEARRLKELLDEQSAFAAEQIDIAIKALEEEIQKSDSAKMQKELHLESQTLQKHLSFYQSTQQALDLLNSQAARINSLRKELIRTEMRVRKKNQFFQRLSTAGDKIFPIRKNLIQELSNKFLEDVEAFISKYFGPQPANAPSFFLRDEIKALQNVAKLLTLNSPTFVKTRMHLSECWDNLKEQDKERKKERAQQKSLFKDNADKLLEQLTAIENEFQEGKLAPQSAIDRLNQFSKEMRHTELGREEVGSLKERLETVRKPINEKISEEEQHRANQETERLKHKQQKTQDLKNEIDQLLNSASSLSVEQLIASREALISKIQATAQIKSEKQEFERKLKPLRDIIAEKKEAALLALPEGDRAELEQLQDVLKQRKERRQEIKDQIEVLRKALGSSSLSFEKAMEYNQQLSEEKERLEKINHGIHEVEEKISQLEG